MQDKQQSDSITVFYLISTFFLYHSDPGQNLFASDELVNGI